MNINLFPLKSLTALPFCQRQLFCGRLETSQRKMAQICPSKFTDPNSKIDPGRIELLSS